MGTESIYVPYIVAAVGAAAGAANDAHTRRKKDKELGASITNQGVKQQEAASEINAQVMKRGRSNSLGAVSNSEAQLMDALRRNKAGGTNGSVVPDVVGASERYRAQTEQGNASVGDYASQLGHDMAVVDGASRQRETETSSDQRLAESIQGIQRRAAGDSKVSQIKMQGMTNNPWIDLASKMAINYGAGAAMRGAGGAFKGAPGGMPTGAGVGSFTPSNYASDPFNAGMLQAYG